jgi:hypothetical protein
MAFTITSAKRLKHRRYIYVYIAWSDGYVWLPPLSPAIPVLIGSKGTRRLRVQMHIVIRRPPGRRRGHERQIAPANDFQEQIRFRLEVRQAGHDRRMIQVPQNEVQSNFFQPAGVVPVRGRQNRHHRVRVYVAANQVFANGLQAVQEKLLAGNEQVNADLERGVVGERVGIQEFQDLEKDGMRDIRQGNDLGFIARATEALVVVFQHAALPHAATEQDAKVLGPNGQNRPVRIDRLAFHGELHVGQVGGIHEALQVRH